VLPSSFAVEQTLLRAQDVSGADEFRYYSELQRTVTRRTSRWPARFWTPRAPAASFAELAAAQARICTSEAFYEDADSFGLVS